MSEFADFGLKILRIWFKKDVEKLVTYKSCGHRALIDEHILMGQDEKVKNVKAVSTEEAIMQHRLIVADFLLKKACRERKAKVNRIKIRRSIERNIQKAMRDRLKTYLLKI